MVARIKFIAKMKAYENKEPFIIFLPVLIFSSSPKLNFLINTPLPTATAAAGVEIFKIQLSILSKAEFILFTIWGSPKAKVQIENKLIKIIKKVNIKKSILYFIL